MLIPNPDLDFWNFDSKIRFCANLGPKIQSCLSCLNISARRISRMLILNPHLDLWNFDPKNSVLGKFGPKYSKFLWKFVLILSQGYWFQIQNPNLFLGKFQLKKSKSSVLSENWYTWYLKDADSYSNVSFVNFESGFLHWENLGQKSQSCPF